MKGFSPCTRSKSIRSVPDAFMRGRGIHRHRPQIRPASTPRTNITIEMLTKFNAHAPINQALLVEMSMAEN